VYSVPYTEPFLVLMMMKKQLNSRANKRVGLKIAKVMSKAATQNSYVRNTIGKDNAAKLDGMIKRSIDKKVNKLKGRGFYSGGRGFYSGRGAYEQVIPNQLVAGTNVKPATLSSIGDETGEIVVSKREYLTDIFSTGSNAFYLEAFAVNPGLSGVFPFLSQIATNYTSYEFIQLLFEYVPVVSQSSTTGAMGTIILACNGNAAAGQFTSKVEMNEYDGSISGRVCDHMVLGVECDPKKLGLQPTLYVRAGAVQSGQDIKTYDLGLFQLALSGVSTAAFPLGTQLGEVWVHYRVKLRKPRLYDSLGFNTPRDIFYASGVGCTAALPFGTSPQKSINNVIGGRLSKATATIYTLPDNFTGYIAVNVFLGASALTVTGDILASTGNVVAVTDLVYSGASASIEQAVAVNQVLAIKHFFVPIATSPGSNTITMSNITVVTTLNTAYWEVTQYNPLPGYIITNGANLSSMIPV